MVNTSCPIHQDKVHCPTCYFAPNGSCEHARIMRERQQAALRIEHSNMEQADNRLTERHR